MTSSDDMPAELVAAASTDTELHTYRSLTRAAEANPYMVRFGVYKLVRVVERKTTFEDVGA